VSPGKRVIDEHSFAHELKGSIRKAAGSGKCEAEIFALERSRGNRLLESHRDFKPATLVSCRS
jgi:hypothetical protein